MTRTERRGLRKIWTMLLDLPRPAHWLLVGICVSRMSAFMVWPFVAVMMNQRFGSSLTEIGAQLSLGALLGIVLSPFTGMLGDKTNRLNIMLLGCALAMACYALMGLRPEPSSYLLAIIGMAIANSLIEPLLRAMLGETVEGEERRSFLFHIRYYLVNLAVAIGPLLGIWFANRNHDGIFALAAAAVVVLTLTILAASRSISTSDQPSNTGLGLPGPSLISILKTVASHRLFLVVLLVNFLLVFVYAQSEDPLTFYLVDLEIENINQTIALLNFTNTAVVLVFHLFLMNWLISLNEKSAYALALVFLMVSQLIIAANFGAWLSVWLLAIACGTLAEIVVMPLFTVMIDKIAPADMRGSFFGISMLAGLGAALAPFLGALAITQLGGAVFFSILALVCIPIGVFGYRVLHVSLASASS